MLMLLDLLPNLLRRARRRAMTDQATNGKEKRESLSLGKRFDLRRLNAVITEPKRLIVLFVLLFVLVSIFLFPPMQKLDEILYKEGDIADVDVIAPFTFYVDYSEQEIEINRSKAALNVPPVYSLNDQATRHLPNDLIVFMDKIGGIAVQDSLSEAEQISLVIGMSPGITEEMARLLLAKQLRDRILKSALELQASLLEKGIINNSAPLRRNNYPHIIVVDGENERLLPSTYLVEQGQLETIILSEAKKLFGRDERTIKLFYDILRSHLMPNLVYDMDEHRRRRDQAEEAVPDKFTVSENERIIAKHDKVTKAQVEMLRALEEKRMALELATSFWKRSLLFFGKALRMTALILLLGLALYRLRPDLVMEAGKSTLVFMIVIFYVLLTALVIKIPILDPYLVPVAFVSLISTAFFGVMTSVMFTLFAAMLLVTHTDLPASYAFIALLAGTTAIVSITQLRERRNFYTIFLYIALAYIIGITGFMSLPVISLSDFLIGSLWGITNSLICTILVMFLLPIFESLFDVTTNFTLMELSDLNRPLLRRLTIEAPGTYHHSLLVGNLVEAVASDVKANSLLARVGAYYHDIGKLAKPEYFFENKGDNINKHEKLTPTMSALILASHVKEGIELAKKEKLPNVVVDTIRQHHGTTVMAYFYQKALEYDSHDSVNIDDFRYPGPRPQSKETALIMLADSAEAAVRSLREPTAPRIRAIVGKIIEARMNDGELDQSGLTLNDVAIIREQYIKLLTGIFHPRISYPSQEKGEGEQVSNRESNTKLQAQGDRKGKV
jgi:putative nucleotidyltransferase with HDIG domain